MCLRQHYLQMYLQVIRVTRATGHRKSFFTLFAYHVDVHIWKLVRYIISKISALEVCISDISYFQKQVLNFDCWTWHIPIPRDIAFIYTFNLVVMIQVYIALSLQYQWTLIYRFTTIGGKHMMELSQTTIPTCNYQGHMLLKCGRGKYRCQIILCLGFH